MRFKTPRDIEELVQLLESEEYQEFAKDLDDTEMFLMGTDEDEDLFDEDGNVVDRDTGLSDSECQELSEEWDGGLSKEAYEEIYRSMGYPPKRNANLEVLFGKYGEDEDE